MQYLSQLPQWAQIALAIVPSLGALFAAGGLILNVLQSRRTNAQARATLVAKCIQEFSTDDEMRAAFYSIEYSEFKYSLDFHNSPEERKLDKLLIHFSNLALAWSAGLLTNKDIKPLQYHVRRILRNSDVKQYINFVEDWSDSADLGEHPYKTLSRLAKKLGA